MYCFSSGQVYTWSLHHLLSALGGPPGMADAMHALEAELVYIWNLVKWLLAGHVPRRKTSINWRVMGELLYSHFV